MVVAAPRYRKLNTFLRDRFGEKVYRVGLCTEFTCPNRDGRKGEGGCIFCNPASSEPLGFVPGTPITLVRRAPLGDPCVYALRGVQMCLRATEAARISVQPVSSPGA